MGSEYHVHRQKIFRLFPIQLNLSLGSSQQVQIVMDSVPNGLAGFNITFNVSDPGIANITGVSLPSWANVSLSRNSTLPSNSVWIKTIDLDGAKPNHTVVPGATNVILGNITITGIKARYCRSKHTKNIN